MDVRSRTIEVMGLRTRILEDGDGAPVVLIHGVGGWAENWRETIAALSANGKRAVAVDLPGFGESDPPRRISHFGPRDAFYPAFMTALFDALGLGTDVALFLRLATLPGMTTFARLVGDRGQGRQVLATCFYDRSRIPQTLYEEADRYGYRRFTEFV